MLLFFLTFLLLDRVFYLEWLEVTYKWMKLENEYW